MSSPSHRKVTTAFIYGTLQLPVVLQRVLGRVPARTPAVLRDYRRGRIVEQPYPAIEAAPGSSVQGLVLADLDDREWQLIDAYEGELYARRTITVTLDNHQLQEASCYVLRDEYAHLFDATSWSLDDFATRDLAALLDDLG